MTFPAAPVTATPSAAGQAATAPSPLGNPAVAVAAGFLAVFAVLLTSFPARNLDLWANLTAGRDLFAAGKFSPTWVYDALAYLVASAAGAGGLVAVKALGCGAVAVLLFRLSAVAGWRVALAVTGLTVLAMGTRLLVQPETASVALLAVGVWLLYRRPDDPPARWYWPGWPLVLLFVVWANTDARAVIGLAVVALVRLGQLLDDRTRGPFGRWVATVLVLAAASCLSVSHVTRLSVPAELHDGWKAVSAPAADAQTVHSPFDPNYVDRFQENSAALTYYPLLALGLLSFVLNRRGWKWGWFLPWVALAVVSGLQARTIPLFAVVAGPVTAWNLQAVLARRPSAQVRPRARYAGLAAGGLIAAAFLVAAWPGWLQGPPYEPRRWAAECPPGLERGAEFLADTHAAGLWAADTRTLHLSADTLGAVRWHCRQDDAFHDPDLVKELLKPEGEENARRQLRERRVSRVVVWAADPNPLAQAGLNLLFSAPTEWRVLSLAGGLVVFGWDDPDRTPGPDPYAGWEVDFHRLGFRPEESERPAAVGPEPHWWEVFWTPARPTRPAGRGEATALLRKADALRRSSTERNLNDWEAAQIAGLVGAGAAFTGPADAGDVAVRLNLLLPPASPAGVRPPPQTELVFALQQRFAVDRGPIPVEVTYAAVRAARRAVADNPTDASSYLVLAQTYAVLNGGTCELGWGRRVTQIQRARQVQMSFALNRAVTLNPRLAQAHFELAALYRSTGCVDLALEHFREYKRWVTPPATGDAAKALDEQLEQLTKQVQARTEAYDKDTVKSSISERVVRANQLELGGKALALLLKSHVSAFGQQGTELELELLVRTGQPRELLRLTDEAPEVRGSVGDTSFHWMRAQALLALGDCDAADAEMRQMAGPDGRRIDPKEAIGELAEAVGNGVLDAQPGGLPLPHLVRFARSQTELYNRVNGASRALSLEANMITVRGVMALEAGHPARAAEAFREALTYTPSPWAVGGQLEFTGRSVAHDGLSLLGER